MKRPVSVEVLEKRNKKIVKLISSGISASEAGRIFGITKERACQIYFKKTGKPIRQLKIQRRLARMGSVDAILKRELHPCLWCAKHKTIYRFCSDLCRIRFWLEVQNRVQSSPEVRNLTSRLRRQEGVALKEQLTKKINA